MLFVIVSFLFISFSFLFFVFSFFFFFSVYFVSCYLSSSPVFVGVCGRLLLWMPASMVAGFRGRRLRQLLLASAAPDAVIVVVGRRLPSSASVVGFRRQLPSASVGFCQHPSTSFAS